ncbi:nonstructural protein [Microviridae sp.]|nr:nonstructural protein [Microviridae sp.]
MEHKAFSVFDDKANCFMPPFFQHTTAMANRVFADAVRTKDHPFQTNPDDYTLYEIGTFDDTSGQIMPCKKILMITSATEINNLSKNIDDTPLTLTEVK